MAIVVSTVRAAIETRLATISGLQTRDRLPDLIDPPLAVCWPSRVDFDEAMGRGLDRYTFSVMVFVCRADVDEAQLILDGYLDASSSTSIKAAVEGGTPARTLGGTVHTCRLTGVTDIGVAEVAGVAYLFAEFELETHG